MKFAGTLVYNKLVANLFIYLVSKFHIIWMLQVAAVKLWMLQVAAVKCLFSGFSGADLRTCLFWPNSVGNNFVMYKSEL